MSTGERRAIDEAALIVRAKNGDADAVAQLVVRYQDVAFRVACLITGDPDEAQDAAQTGFIKALRALHSFRDGAPFRPWLLRIVANEARNRVRAASRRLAAPLDERIVSLDPSPVELVERHDANVEVLAALRSLDAGDQHIIALRYFLDCSEAEMADLLDCPRGTVKSRLSRALGRLRAQMEPDMEGKRDA